MMRDIKTLVRPNVLALTPYSSARDEFKETEASMIFLDANENPVENRLNRYPDPQQRALKSAIAKVRSVTDGQILLGNGSDEVLDLIIRAFCEPNTDNVITLPPTYGMYSVLAAVNAVEERRVQLTSDFQPDLDGIAQKTDENSKILFLCSPNNPTGNLFSVEEITTLLHTFTGLVVVDEAYIDFCAEASWIEKLEEYPNLIIVQTFSKAHGLAGIRLGACFASKEIIAVLNKIKAPYNVNTLTQDKAAENLASDIQLKSSISEIIAEREKLSRELNAISFVQKVYESDANFLLFEVDNADRRYQQLIERGIVVRNRSKQPLCQNCLRITVGTAVENEIVINTLKTLNR
jgi:histidinol-phosphate aminotransferase